MLTGVLSDVCTSAATIFSLGFRLIHFSSFSPVTLSEQPFVSMMDFIFLLRWSRSASSSIQDLTPDAVYSLINPNTTLLMDRYGTRRLLSGGNM